MDRGGRRLGQRLYVALLFFAAVVSIYVAIPRSAPFYYEFQRGRVWMYETLKAPFDYPLYKSQADYQAEREAILQQQRPIFREDLAVPRRVRNALEGRVRSCLAARRDSLVGLSQALQAGEMANGYDAAHRQRLEQALAHVYDMGVVEEREVLRVAPDGAFAVLRQGIAYEATVETVFTPERAARFVVRACALDTAASIWGAVDVAGCMQVNLQYDSVLTAQLYSERLAHLSTTQGLVESGSEIIGRGDVVTEERYRKLESLQREMSLRQPGGGWMALQEVSYAILTLLILGLYLIYLRHSHAGALRDRRVLLFLMLVLALFVVSGYVVLSLEPTWLYIVPFALAPLLVRSFLDARLAFMTHLVITSCVALFAPSSYEFMLINFSAGLVAVFAQKTIYRRSRFLVVVLLVLLSYLFSYLTLKVIQEQTLTSLGWQNMGFFVVNAVLLLATSQLTWPLEKLFGFISNSTLVDLGDTNQPLLALLSEKASGTFQHSLQVANLAEACAMRIEANSLLVRTGALYHDVGKLRNPEYFVENHHGGINPHQRISEIESAEIIIRHVQEGVELARKDRLPEQIVDFIRTHHGTSRTEYFYRTFRRNHPEEPDHAEWFTYPGPKPRTREMAIVMMADSVEAASRSLREITPGVLRNFVESIVSKQQQEGQFDETDLTFSDLLAIKEVLVRKLESIYHTRVEYPEAPPAPSET